MKKVTRFSMFCGLLLAVSCTDDKVQSPSENEPGKPGVNAAIVDQFNKDLFSDHNTDRLETILADNFIAHHFPSATGNNSKGDFIGGMKGLFAGFPDITATMIEQREFGEKVFQYGFWEATQSGDFMGIPATGKKVHVEYMDIWRVENDKLAENWVVMDIMGLMIQLGVIPPPGS